MLKALQLPYLTSRMVSSFRAVREARRLEVDNSDLGAPAHARNNTVHQTTRAGCFRPHHMHYRDSCTTKAISQQTGLALAWCMMQTSTSCQRTNALDHIDKLGHRNAGTTWHGACYRGCRNLDTVPLENM
jgi:hypothetical protein